MSDLICPVCGDKPEWRQPVAYDGGSWKCPRCGEFESTFHAEANMRSGRPNLPVAAWIRRANLRHQRPKLDSKLVDQLLNEEAPSVERKLQMLLEAFASSSNFPGHEVLVVPDFDASLAHASNTQEFSFYLSTLNALGLIKQANRDGSIFVVVTAGGWERVSSLRAGVDSARVFVAMSFGEDLKPLFHASIKPALRRAGWDAFLVDEKPHNGHIDQKIMADIKSSRFVVADFSENKKGVYFEAGYALGLGKQVIWTVRESDINDLHFDTRQIGHVVWKDAASLADGLFNAVVAIIGRGPLVTPS